MSCASVSGMIKVTPCQRVRVLTYVRTPQMLQRVGNKAELNACIDTMGEQWVL